MKLASEKQCSTYGTTLIYYLKPWSPERGSGTTFLKY